MNKSSIYFNFDRFLKGRGKTFMGFVIDCMLCSSVDGADTVAAILQDLPYLLKLEADYNKTVRGLGKDSVKATKWRHKKSWTKILTDLLWDAKNMTAGNAKKNY